MRVVQRLRAGGQSREPVLGRREAKVREVVRHVVIVLRCVVAIDGWWRWWPSDGNRLRQWWGCWRCQPWEVAFHKVCMGWDRCLDPGA
eukprot:1799781-Pleurochrysis_carterae.AAC.2